MAEEVARLDSIAALAKVNGVHNLQCLSKSDVAALEPEVRCTRALLSPSAGIIDVSGFMLALQGEANTYGTIFAFNAAFRNAVMLVD